MKTCFKCHQAKPLAEFYKHPQMADGHLNKCKHCAKRDVQDRYNLVGGRADYERERSQRPERKTAAAKYQRDRRRKNPIKAKAWRDVGRAIASGKLVRQSCRVCGSSLRVQAHHHDYSKPLDIEWLCFKCHREYAHGQTTRAA